MTDPDPREELQELTRDVRAHLEYQSAAGATAHEAPAPELPAPPPELARPERPPRPSRPPTGRQAPQGRASAPTTPRGGGEETLEQIRAELGDCTRCDLSERRNKLVFGDGHPRARVVFVGEAPGYDEDRQGIPFVGKAGRMLTDMITHVLRMERGQVYICNVLKCRPPDNRDPLPTEVMTCTPFLERQLAALRPLVIVALGRFAAQHLLQSTAPVGRLRGRAHDRGEAKLIVTYHPAYLLRNPHEKRKAMDDLMLIRSTLEQATGEALPPVLRRRR